MPYFSYEARDQKGMRIKGNLEAESSEKVAKMLHEMGYTPVVITSAAAPKLKLYYVGKDKDGNTKSGSITATNIEDASRQLRDMGLVEYRFSTRKNLDTPSDDTAADKASKQIAHLLIFLLFGATAVFLMAFPHYIESYLLEPSRSRVTEAQIVDVSEDGVIIRYTFELGGKTYKRYDRPDKKIASTLKAGDTVQVRYSAGFPSINHLEGRVPLATQNVMRTATISGLLIVLIVMGLIYCSSFHYIGRIRAARRVLKPVPGDDVKRLMANIASGISFPLIFICMIGAFLGQDKASFFYPYKIYFILGSVLLLAGILIIRRKSPVYYD